MSTKNKKIIKIMISAIFFISVPIYIAWHNGRENPLELYVIPLRFSQAILIRTPAKKNILIDGGSTKSITTELGNILPFYVKNIDIVILTVADDNHATGLVDVINRYGVEELFVPAYSLQSLGLATTTENSYEYLLKVAKTKGVSVKSVERGDILNFAGGHDPNGYNQDISIEILFPAEPKDFVYSKASGPEIIWQLKYGSSSIISFGKATPKIQKYVIQDLVSFRDKSIGVQNSSQSNIIPTVNNDIDIFLFFKNPSKDNLSINILEFIRPKYLIYSKIPEKITALNSAVSKNNGPNDYADIINSTQNKKTTPSGDMQSLNIRETGVLRFLYNTGVTEGTEGTFLLYSANTLSRDYQRI